MCARAAYHSERASRVLWVGSACGFASKGRIVSHELQLSSNDLKERTIDLRNKPDEFVAEYARASPVESPVAKTPLLVEDDAQGNRFRLIESDPVAHYLSETFGNRLSPHDSWEAARMRMFIEAAWSSTVPSYTAVLRAENTSDVHSRLDELVQQWRIVNQGLLLYGTWDPVYAEKKPFVFGDRFTVADAIAAPFIYRQSIVLSDYYGVSIEAKLRANGLHRALAWFEAVCSRESVIRTAPTPEHLVEHAKERFIALKE